MVMPTREELQAQINQRLGLPSDYAGATAPQAQGPVAPDVQSMPQAQPQPTMQTAEQRQAEINARMGGGYTGPQYNGAQLGAVATGPVDPYAAGRASQAQSAANQADILGQHQAALDTAQQVADAGGYQAYLDGTAQVDVNGRPMSSGQMQGMVDQQRAQRNQAIQQQYRAQQAKTNSIINAKMSPRPQGPVRPQGQPAPQQRQPQQQNSFMQYASYVPKAMGALGGIGSFLGGLF